MMDKTILISLPVEDLQTLIIDCVNSCLNHHAQKDSKASAADRWMSLEELCDYLPGKPARATIYGYVHRREIPHKKFGNKRLAFLKSEIDTWLKSKGRMTQAEVEAKANEHINKTRGGAK